MKHDELDLNRELLEQEYFETGENHLPERLPIAEVVRDTPASQLQETDHSDQVRCSFCKCFMVGMMHGFRVCQHHKDCGGESAPPCPTCARRSLMSTPTYIASGHKTDPVHPTPPAVLPELPNVEPSAIQSAVTQDVDIEGTVKAIAHDTHVTPDKTELNKEYWDTFNSTIEEVKDLEPEQLQQVRHRMLRMIRRAKIAVNAIVKLEEGRIQLIESKERRARIQAAEAEFQSRRRAQGDATVGEKKTKKSGEGLSQIEKQVKQFVKLNMDEAVIRTTFQALGTKIPENLPELIARFKK